MNFQDTYEIKVAAVNNPLRLVDVKNFLKVQHDADDLLINSLITTATILGEKYTGRSFEQRTFTGKFSGLLRNEHAPKPFIELRRGPLVSLTSVKVTINSVLTNVLSTDYYLSKNGGYSRIFFINSPSVDDNLAYPLEVEFITGYATIPEAILTALKSHILFMFENRGDIESEGKNLMPSITKSIYDSSYTILNTF